MLSKQLLIGLALLLATTIFAQASVRTARKACNWQFGTTARQYAQRLAGLL